MQYLIPYGISNFAQMRSKNYLYVDKTHYIEILENEAPFQFFIRPRRFGKSLFVSTLEHYYDINQSDQFNHLFGDTYIGQNPTPDKNSYLILNLSFAGVVTNQGERVLVDSFDHCVISAVKNFIHYYADFFETEIEISNIDRAEKAIREIIYAAKSAGKKIFLLIDEYDNFANDIIGQGNENLYYDLLSSEGYVRAFYKAIKDGTTISIARVFLTGVSPIMLDDLTSGFNITKNITLHEKLNSMLGFDEQEVRYCLQLLDISAEYEGNDIMEDLKKYYNGYRFSKKSTTSLFNTDMVLYFFDSLLETHCYPEEILDHNVKTDYRKLRNLAFNFRDEQAIENLLKTGEVVTSVTTQFNLAHMYEKKENFLSLLFYLGMLTIKEPVETKMKLCIPNYVIRTIFWDYFVTNLEQKAKIDIERLENAVRKMRLEGTPDEFIQFLTRYLEELSNRDLLQFDEKNLKLVIIALFHLTGIYVITSELETSAGYIDLLLTKDIRYTEFTKYEWLIELKYVKVRNKKETEEKRKEGIRMVSQYAATKEITSRCKAETLKRLVLTVVGKSEILIDWVT